MASPISPPLHPAPAGRLSPLGAIMTVLESLHTVSLVSFVPFMLMQTLYCGSEECHINGFPSDLLQQTCEISKQTPTWIQYWWSAEVLFYLVMRIKLAYLQSIDPQESYFQAARTQTKEERQLLWDRVMEADSHDAVGYFESWFFDRPIESISMEELKDFVAWGFFDNRNQEHLTEEETQQLEVFVNDAFQRITIQKEKTFSANTIQLRRGSTLSTVESFSSSDEEEEDDSTASPQPSSEIDAPQKIAVYQTLLQIALTKSQKLPATEVAEIMKKITKLSQQSGGFHMKPRKWRFGRPTADPLLGVRISPLMIHLLVFLTTELPAYFLFWALGFQRKKAGSVTYYYRRGKSTQQKTPCVFIHGIGVGPIIYLPLVLFMMVTSERPLFVPEIQSVSAFRPWILPKNALTPEQVATSLSMMLVTHGFAKATFVGHSFGTFWMSYMIKEVPDMVAGLVFLDPVNFCLKNSLLTRRVVYNPPDPGDIAYMVRTDMMVNWSIQRNFSWVRGNLFAEDLGDKPCAVFLSGDDNIAPSAIQKSYLASQSNFRTMSVNETSSGDFEQGNSLIVFPNCDHGMWMLNPLQNLPKVVNAMEILTKRAEKQGCT